MWRRIFGEVITFIERDKRGLKFTTAQDRVNERSLPENLYFVGTMNTADKSISLLDVALRRRFAFIGCYPDPSAYASVSGWATTVAGVDVGSVLSEINSRLAGHGVEKDRQIGHAMLAVSAHATDPEQEFLDRLQYDVLPLVEEYLYSEPESVADVLPVLADARDRGDALTASDFAAVTGNLLPKTRSTLGERVSVAAASARDAGGDVAEDEDAEAAAHEDNDSVGTAETDSTAAVITAQHRVIPISRRTRQ